jgi:hypothetical protein
VPEDEGKLDHLGVSLSAAVGDLGEGAQQSQDVGPLIAMRWKFLL